MRTLPRATLAVHPLCLGGNRARVDRRQGPGVRRGGSGPRRAGGAVALAAQETVAAPIASARTIEQLDGLLALDGLELTAEEVDRLSAASS